MVDFRMNRTLQVNSHVLNPTYQAEFAVLLMVHILTQTTAGPELEFDIFLCLNGREVRFVIESV